eukprot:scaffold26237_cov107-Isochrysis_galbana.AAC.3
MDDNILHFISSKNDRRQATGPLSAATTEPYGVPHGGVQVQARSKRRRTQAPDSWFFLGCNSALDPS